MQLDCYGILLQKDFHIAQLFKMIYPSCTFGIILKLYIHFKISSVSKDIGLASVSETTDLSEI
jgi:hypothetical protein